MNSAYPPAPHAGPLPHDLLRADHAHALGEGPPAAAYRPPHGAYAHPHAIPQSMNVAPSYHDHYAHLPSTRPPESLQGPAPDGTMTARDYALPTPPSKACVEHGRRYELTVEQEPQRARMCGFGDKDRRPITPPPCVRLMITDMATGKEVDVNEIDHGMFVLNVDLWSVDGTREVNLVRSSSNSPANAPSVSQAYMDGNQSYANAREQPNYGQQSYPGFQGSYGQPYNANRPAGQNYPPPSDYPAQYPGGQYKHGDAAYSPTAENAPHSAHSITSYSGRPFTPGDVNVRPPASSSQPTGMFTRNLIGSLAASAFRLMDPRDRLGIWFVLQDLSVRTEGSFRLRFSFVNVGAPPSPSSAAAAAGPSPSNPQSLTQSALVNTGRAPVLASCFSDVFTVYSAKKFPGVVESTALSKCFATQGIKIPIRKDAQAGGKGKSGPGHGGGDDFDDDD